MDFLTAFKSQLTFINVFPDEQINIFMEDMTDKMKKINKVYASIKSGLAHTKKPIVVEQNKHVVLNKLNPKYPHIFITPTGCNTLINAGGEFASNATKYVELLGEIFKLINDINEAIQLITTEGWSNEGWICPGNDLTKEDEEWEQFCESF